MEDYPKDAETHHTLGPFLGCFVISIPVCLPHLCVYVCFDKLQIQLIADNKSVQNFLFAHK